MRLVVSSPLVLGFLVDSFQCSPRIRKSPLAQPAGAETASQAPIVLRGAARVAIFSLLDFQLLTKTGRLKSTSQRSEPRHVLEEHMEIVRRAKRAADVLEKQ